MNFTNLEKFDFKLPEQPIFELIKLAYTDALTGCYNRNMLEEMRNHLDGLNLFITIVDINDLKIINDNHGHYAGDRTIKRVAKDLLWFGDLAFRLGGDEFLLINWETPYIGMVAHISWGGFHKTAEQSLSYAMQMADEAMYKMKNERKEMLKQYVNDRYGVKNAQTRNSSE